MWSRSTFLAILFAASLPLSAEDEQTRLRVEVMTLGGKPVDRASVIVDYDRGRSVVKLGKKVITHWEVRTSQEGIAKIPPLPRGSVRIQVIAKGFQTFGGTYELKESEQTIAIKLNPPQPQHTEHQ